MYRQTTDDQICVKTFCSVAYSLIGNAGVVCGAGSMNRYGVRPSVCPIFPLQQRAAGLLLWARW